MYVPDSQQCAEFNSATPMPASWVTSQDAMVAAIGARFVAGNQALYGLVADLGGNVPAVAGVPASLGPAAVPPPSPYPAGSVASMLAPAFRPPAPVPTRSLVPGGRRRMVAALAPACSLPVALPLVTVFPIPAAGASRPAAPAAPAVRPAPAPGVSPARRTQAQCRTGSICYDLRAGCVAASQVSRAQLAACARAGWSGNLNLFPDVISQAGLPYLGDVDLSPPPAASSGLAGLGDGLFTTSPAAPFVWGGLAALAFLAWTFKPVGKGR